MKPSSRSLAIPLEVNGLAIAALVADGLRQEDRMADASQRTDQHEALRVFLGKWSARGISFGGTDQAGDDPRRNGQPWVSTHEASWHTGKFFLLQDERADIAGDRFDTYSIPGTDDDGHTFRVVLRSTASIATTR